MFRKDQHGSLTGIFGLKNVSGVGISFGLDRIYLVLEELNAFPETVSSVSKVIFLNFGDKEVLYVLPIIQKLRNAGVKTELYPDNTKMGKQFQFADKKGIQFAVIVGESEMENKQFAQFNIPQEKFQFVSGQDYAHDKKLETKPVGYLRDAMRRFAKPFSSALKKWSVPSASSQT